MSRTRQEQVRDEKGEHPDHMTSGEVARYLGITSRTLQRHVRAGSFPAPAARTENGWGLWSPAQQQLMLRKVAKL